MRCELLQHRCIQVPRHQLIVRVTAERPEELDVIVHAPDYIHRRIDGYSFLDEGSLNKR